MKKLSNIIILKQKFPLSFNYKKKMVLSVITAFFSFCIFSTLQAQNNAIKVQRGFTDIQNQSQSTTVDLTANGYSPVSSLSNAFVRITDSSSFGAGHITGGDKVLSKDLTACIKFDSTSQISVFRSGDTGITRVYWEIVEYIGTPGDSNEFIVRDRGTLTMNNTSLTANTVFNAGSSVSTLVGFVTGVIVPDATTDKNNSGLITASFPNAGELSLRRGTTGTDITVSYAVVDFTGSNWLVQRLEHNYQNVNTVESGQLQSNVNTDNTFIYVQKRNGPSQNRLADFGHNVWLSASDTVSFKLQARSIDPNEQYSVAWVISNSDMSVIHLNGSRSKNDPEPDIYSLSFSPQLTSLDNGSVFINNTCKGTGKFFPRPIIGTRLTAADQVELFRSDTGQTQNYYLEIVDWPYDKFNISGTIYTDQTKTSVISAGETVALSVNGATVSTTLTQTDGTFSFALTAPPNPNDVLLIYIDGSALKSSLVTVSDGTTELTGSNALEMFLDSVVLEHQAGTEITNAQLSIIAGVDAGNDDGITVDTNNNAQFDNGLKVIIPVGGNYTPGADVSLESISIQGTFTPETHAVNISKIWEIIGGNFVYGTSTINFVSTITATIKGDNSFYNFTCKEPGKKILFEQNTTQTINGKLLVDGDDFPTRILFESSGGAGTTWNIIFNGTYDCRYIQVQGSNASGTAFLPVYPVAFKDNGDNTNWYSSDFPKEMLFYDNFETSTLNSSPPDKTSSYWTINNATWLTTPSVVVNNLNHTLNGSQSMFSSGGAANNGIGVWNDPAWGSVQNASAEAWFYDDLQNDKKEWLFLDNTAGSQGIGILIETDQGQGAVKYRYCVFGFNGNGAEYYDSYIDRTQDWHHVKWIHSDGNVELYIDDSLLVSKTGLSDFSTFDTGSWNWHNTSGSTPMYFDDFRVYRSEHLSHYRWYENDNAQNPTSIDSEDTPVEWNINQIVRLRVQLINDMHDDWNNTKIALQCKESVNDTWRMLSSSEAWDYADGVGTDKALLTNSYLSGTNVLQSFVESNPSADIENMTHTQLGEWDFSITSTSNAAIGTTYYFRVVEVDASGSFLQELASYQVYPEIKLISPSLWVWTGRFSQDWSNRMNWSTYSVPNSTSDVIIPNNARRDCTVDISGAACNSLTIEDARQLFLDQDNTDLTVEANITSYGSIIHSSNSATLNLHAGRLLLSGTTALYDHLGNGSFNAPNADIKLTNSSMYSIHGSPSITADNIITENSGNFLISAPASIEANNIFIYINSQFKSTSTTNYIDIAGDFINNGTMYDNAGGVFRFHNTGTIGGSSTTTTFYQAEFYGDTTIQTTNTIKVLDNLTIHSGDSLSASSGKLIVGGNWLNDSGTFTHSNGSVELNGTAQQSVTTGNSPFYHLIQTNASASGVLFADNLNTAILDNTTEGSKMTFTVGTTALISEPGGLILQGTSGNEISLVSSVPGSYWEINPSGAGWHVDSVAVSDSVNIYEEEPIYPTNSTNNGHNINWFSYDSDNDKMPDIWEYNNYKTLSNPLVYNSTTDTDSDEVNNLEEFVLETDPNVQNNAPGDIIYVEDNAGYTNNDGTISAPYKYLEDALNAAHNGSLIILQPGTYVLDNYNLTKRVVIRGNGANSKKVTIHSFKPTGSTSDDGQCLQVNTNNFLLSNLTIRKYMDLKPIFSLSPQQNHKTIAFNNVIFRDNSIGSKYIISSVSNKKPKLFYLINNLVYSNIAEGFAELYAKRSIEALNLTVTENTFTTSISFQEARRSRLINSIVRNLSATELTGSNTNLSVYNSNIQGGFSGAFNSYDSTEIFADYQNGYYQLLPSSPGIDAGITTNLPYDINRKPRISNYDVGAYELDPADSDSDGLSNADEATAGSNINNPDSDNDGLTDGEEVDIYATDPVNNNTDGDFIIDGLEPAMGMNPAVHDGVGDIAGVYYTSFENDSLFPAGPLANTIWGPVGNPNSSIVIKGQMTIENTGSAFAYNGVKVAKALGQIPESSFIGWVDRNSLDDYWISISWRTPRAKLPTDINEAFNMAGAFMAIDENGFLNIWDPNSETWRTDTVAITTDWVRITVHRDHPGRTVDVWIDQRLIFAGVPISGPDPSAGTGKFRMSMSSVGEFDAYTDLWSSLPYSPF